MSEMMEKERQGGQTEAESGQAESAWGEDLNEQRQIRRTPRKRRRQRQRP